MIFIIKCNAVVKKDIDIKAEMHSVVTSAMPSLPSCVFLAYASLVGLVGPTLADEVKNTILICISSEKIIFYDTIHFICIMSYIAHDSSRTPST